MLEYRFDDNDSLALTIRDLDHLIAQREQQHRPLKFRTIVRMNRSVPWFMESVRSELIEHAGTFVPIGMSDDSELPEPSIKRTQGNRQPIVSFAAKYSISRGEKERAQRMGIDVESKKSIANQVAAEAALDQIAANGVTPYPSLTLGTGLLANTDVTVDSTSLAAWDDTTDPTKILDFLTKLGTDLHIDSKEVSTADTLVLPVTHYALIMRKEMDKSHKTILEALRDREIYSRVLSWHKAETAGASSKRRILALDSRNPMGPEMILSQELTDGTPIRKHFSLEIPQVFVTAGIRVDDPSTMRYGDVPAS